MVENPPADMARVNPAVFYQDPTAAIQWLVEAFGFHPRLSIPGEDGEVVHAELAIEDGVVMLGPAGSHPGARSPSQLEGQFTQAIYVYVSDVDEHYRKAAAAGAEIVAELTDQFYGDRTYSAIDLEGHRWTFGQHTRDVDLSEMMPSEDEE